MIEGVASGDDGMSDMGFTLNSDMGFTLKTAF